MLFLARPLCMKLSAPPRHSPTILTPVIWVVGRWWFWVRTSIAPPLVLWST